MRDSAMRQRGFSAALVMVVLTLMTLMLGFAVSMNSGLHSAIAQEVAQSRAEQAAKAGIEWARYQLRFAAACAPVTSLAIPFTSGATTVTVSCTLTGTYTEGGPTVRTYQLSATACSPAAAGACPNPAGGSDYVERTVSGYAER